MSSLQAPPPDASSPATLRVAIVVPFLNEAALMPRFLGSMLAQTRRPDLLLLVDDGSTDASKGMAAEFAAQHDFARVLQRPPRPPAKDRLATAAELQAFHWGVEQLDEPFDVIAKVDADLEFAPRHVETLLAELAADPELGIVGCYLAVEEPTGIRREPSPAYHVRGPTKFYRRECLEAIEPLPEILGWDGFDQIRARRAGWTVRSVECQDRDTLHLRPTGSHDGRLRAYRRWGRCAWGYGCHPLVVLGASATRLRHRPYGIAGLAYLWGWVHAAITRAPRVDRETRRYGQRAQLRQIAGRLSR